MTDRQTALYRHFNADGDLLYVGVAFNALARQYQHSRDSSWFDETARIEIERFQSRRLAMKAEGVAIAGENPKYNRMPGSRTTHFDPTPDQAEKLAVFYHSGVFMPKFVMMVARLCGASDEATTKDLKAYYGPKNTGRFSPDEVQLCTERGVGKKAMATFLKSRSV